MSLISSTISLHRSSTIGIRPTNEDVERQFLNLSNYLMGSPNFNPDYGLVDVIVLCDGHGGKRVATFVANKLESFFSKKNNTFPMHHNVICKVYTFIQNQVISQLDKAAFDSGCTALVLIRYLDKTNKSWVQVINLGDCRAVLSKGGIAVPLCKDHKPHWPEEKLRIARVNHTYGTNEEIYFDGHDWRIKDLSVSRAFGDLDNCPYVTHIPDSYVYPIINNDKFIIAACDGLWDVITNHDAVNFVTDHMNNNQINTYNIPRKYPSDETRKSKNIAKKLSEFAIANGSTDNVSVLIIIFD